MALNKSSKSTPSLCSSYFSEITASAGKQRNFLLPVRIKVTPKTTIVPLSDGKKNPAKMLQPVLIKDLLQSTQKDRRNSTVTSASTVKKKARSQKFTQSYLSTQSCYKPQKDQVDDSDFLSRKSCGGNKVRRQLYQSDSPQKSVFENKENLNKNVNKPKKKTIQKSEEAATKSSKIESKNRKSFLLPPNSIRNSFMRKSGPNLKIPEKRVAKSNVTITNKTNKGTSRVTETQKSKYNSKKNFDTDQNDENDTEIDFSSSYVNEQDRKQSDYSIRDNFTMTTPSIGRVVNPSNDLNNLTKFERPSVIMSPSKVSYNLGPPCYEKQHLNISKTPCSSTNKATIFNEQSKEFDFTNMIDLNSSGLSKLKSFIEQSIQASEEQLLKLKQILNFINNMQNNTAAATTVSTHSKNNLEIDQKCNVSSTIISNEDDSNGSDIVETSLETSNEIDTVNEIMVPKSANKTENTEKLPIPLKILVSDADLNQEAKEIFSAHTLSDTARLSTIGEVSCEVDDSNKDEKDNSENKENINNSIKNMTLDSPKTPKTPRRRSAAAESCGSQIRRRSVRLAAKRMSLSTLSDSDKTDSFTLLENELNVVHDPVPSKSLPASPMKPPMTPGISREWNKKVERPLKEYMALKMNGTFLVTPDVKRFQSVIEPSETPHSRKSLSRKIFMELCDLYAESPEHE